MAAPPKTFTAYSLPRERRRHGPAAVLSAIAHLVVAAAVLWRGAALFEPGAGGAGPRGGGGGGGRPAVTTWFALPPASAPAAVDVPALAVTVPALALPDPAPIEVPAVPAAPPPTAVAPAGTGEGTAGGSGQGPGSGGGQGTGSGTGSGSVVGPGTGGDGGRIFPASPRWSILPPPGAPSTVRGRAHQVRFWVTAEGRVTRVEVVPPIKDGKYRREFVERMMGYLFNPATTVDGRPIESVAFVTLTF